MGVLRTRQRRRFVDWMLRDANVDADCSTAATVPSKTGTCCTRSSARCSRLTVRELVYPDDSDDLEFGFAAISRLQAKLDELERAGERELGEMLRYYADEPSRDQYGLYPLAPSCPRSCPQPSATPVLQRGVRAQYRARQENAGNDGAREGGNVA
jgi:hypothetical protein